MMKRTAIIALAALAFCQLAGAQTEPMSSTLYQTYNATSALVGFNQCNESNPIAMTAPAPTSPSGEPLTPISDSDAANTMIDAIWFGGSVGAASNFQVVGNCSALQLTANGGHGTTIYTGPVPMAPNGCTGTWYKSENYLILYVAITNTGFAWSVSLPLNSNVRAQTSCNGGYQYCPLASGVPCSTILDMPQVLRADGTPAPAAAPAPAENSVKSVISTLG